MCLRQALHTNMHVTVSASIVLAAPLKPSSRCVDLGSGPVTLLNALTARNLLYCSALTDRTRGLTTSVMRSLLHSSSSPQARAHAVPGSRCSKSLRVLVAAHTSSCCRARLTPVHALPNNQQTDPELESSRQQGGYNYPPPPRSQPQQTPQQQPQQQHQQQWGWPQQQQQQQRPQQQEPWNWQQPEDAAAQSKAGGKGKGGNGGGNNNNNGDGGGLSGYTKALIAAAFVTGLGAGVYFDAEINLSPNQVGGVQASRQLLGLNARADRYDPNPLFVGQNISPFC